MTRRQCFVAVCAAPLAALGWRPFHVNLTMTSRIGHPDEIADWVWDAVEASRDLARLHQRAEALQMSLNQLMIRLGEVGRR